MQHARGPVLFLETLSSSAEGSPCSQGHWMVDWCLCTQQRPTPALVSPWPTGSKDNTEGRHEMLGGGMMPQGNLEPPHSKPDPDPWPSGAPCTWRETPISPGQWGCRGRDQMAGEPYSFKAAQAGATSTQPLQLGTPIRVLGDEAGLP